jgi:hypothetical protein
MTRRTKIVLGFTAVAAVAAVVIWAGFGRSAANKQRLIGTWAFVGGGNGWRGMTLTFTEGGEMKTSSRWAGKTYESEGTYAVKGDTIEMLVADDSDWSDWTEATWGDWAKKAGGGKSDRPNTDTQSRPQSQPKQQKEPALRRVTIRSLSETELIVADEGGHKTVYARK